MKKALKVLLIEDSPDDAALIERHLRRGKFEPVVTRVKSAMELHRALRESGWDVILSDYRMPNFSGLQAFEILRETGKDIPFIIVSGTIGEETAVAAMKSGVQDYVMKGKLSRLIPVVERELADAIVRRKQYEGTAALQAVEQKYRQVIENATEAIYTATSSGDFTYANEAALRMTGYSLDELRQTNFLNLVLPEYRSRVAAHYHRQLLRKTPGSYIEFPFKSKNGETLWFGQNATPEILDNRVTGFHLIARDITERKQTEESLRLLSTAVNAAANAILIADREGNIQSVNPAFTALTGYTAEEALGRNPRALVKSGAHDEAFYENLWETILAGKVWRGEMTNRRKDGTLYIEEQTITPLVNDRGDVVQFVAIKQDVTRRKRAEEALRNSEERHRALFRLHPQPQWVYDLETLSFLDVNDAAIARYGYTREEFLHMTIKDIRPEEDIPALLDNVARVTEGLTNSGPWRHRKKDGSIIFVEISSHTLSFEGRRAELVMANDITRRTQTEEKLRNSEILYRDLVENSNEVSYLLDQNLNLTYISPVIEARTGFRPSELIGRRFAHIIHSDDVKAVMRTFRAAVLRNQAVPSEFRFMAKSGAPLWVRASVVPLMEDGKLASIRGVAIDVTERKMAEDALKVSEERFRTLTETASSAIMIYQGENLRYVNSAAERMLGYTREEITAMKFWEIIHPDEQAMVRDRGLARQRGETVPTNIEVRVLTKTGQVRWIDFTAAMIVYDGKRAVLGTAFDITGRKQAEEALLAERGLLKTLIDHLPDRVYVKDTENRFMLNNIQHIRALGAKTQQEILGKNDHDFRPSEIADRSRKDDESVIRSGQPSLNREEQTILPSGELHWHLVSKVPIRNTKGEITGLVGISRNITERKQTEEQLRESERRYREFFENDLTGDYISTPDGRLLECNPAFLKIFGFMSREEALQTTLEALHSHPGTWKEFLDRLRKEKTIIYREGTGRRIDGTPIHFVENIMGVFDGRGDLVEIRGYLFDDTKRKQLEQQFFQVQKMESIGTLAGGIAHDFNNILGIIMGHASLMNRLVEDPSKLSQSVDAIQKATNRGAALVRQLLTFARKTDMQIQSVRVNDLIREITGLLDETFPKLITVSTNLKNDLPSISADPTQIHQVLLNLCVNARDAMPDGGTLTLSTSMVSTSLIAPLFPEAVAVEYLAVEVADTGMGMDDATKRRMFEPFFTTKELGKGTGLGLSLVHSIVANHNGFIDVQSTPGVGTAFRLYFPTERQIPAQQKRIQQLLADIPGGTETVLVIEDEELLRELLVAALMAKGYTVLTAEDGMAGVALFERHRDAVAVIISDFGLPRLRGDAVLKLVRSIKSDAKFIVASGYLEPRIKAEMETNGCRHFLQKPYAAEEVLSMMREVIDAKTM